MIKQLIPYFLVAAFLVGSASKISSAKNASALQSSVAREVIRFHVLANSDSEADQQLKLKVRDKVIAYTRTQLENCHDIQDARETILHMEDELVQIAQDVVYENGYSYEVTADLGTSYFPEKTYDDLTFPAGDYEALQIYIGEARGHNWWCVLFPSLCFIDESTATMPESSRETLRKSLTVEEYEALTNGNDEITYRLALFDWLNK